MDWTKGPSGTQKWAAEYSNAPITYKTGVLAESWEILDEETVVFHLRKGVHFAVDPKSEASRLVNGRELNADDVVFSIKRNFDTSLDAYMTHRWSEPRMSPRHWPRSPSISLKT